MTHHRVLLMKRILSIHLALLALILVTAPAQAHRPVWGEELGPIEVDDFSISYAFYQELQSGEMDVFYFEAAAGDRLNAGIQIPDIPALREYGVTMALFGPGLPDVDESLLPQEHPEGLGALLVPSEISEDFFEPFTQTNYWGRQRIEMSLPETGTYYLLVWQPENKAGKYVIDIGYKEEFSISDLFVFPIWWTRAQFFHEHTATVVSLYGLITIAAGWFIYRRVRSKRSPTTQ